MKFTIFEKHSTLTERLQLPPMIKKILDRLLLFSIGTLFLSMQDISAQSVAVWLIALSLTALGLYFDEKRAAIGLPLFYGVLCLFFPALLFFLPVICYDGFWHRCLWCFVCLLPVIVHWERFPLWVWIVTASGLFASALLSYGTRQSSFLSAELIRLRDTATERDMLQQTRNRQLLEKQDSEIHLATLQERNRIAREIHDNVGHMLTRSILQIGALRTIHREEPLHEQLCGINDTLNEAMTSIRQSVHNLHDDAIDLEQAVRDSLQDIEDTYRVTFEYDMSRGIPREIKYCFIAIVKEAVSNIVKHSDGDAVALKLREHPAFYQMLIEDNGHGYLKEEPRTAGSRSFTGSEKRASESGSSLRDIPGDSGGIGLYNMRERVQALGGTLHIRSENGFHIFVTIQK